MARFAHLLITSFFILVSHSSGGDRPEIFDFRISSDSSQRLSALSLLSLAESYFSTESDIAFGHVIIQIDEEKLDLEFFDTSKSEIPMCSFGIELTNDALVMDDEKIEMKVFLERMANYSETARLTESTPGVYFRVAPDVSIDHFFNIASAMSSVGVSRILVAYYDN